MFIHSFFLSFFRDSNLVPLQHTHALRSAQYNIHVELLIIKIETHTYIQTCMHAYTRTALAYACIQTCKYTYRIYDERYICRRNDNRRRWYMVLEINLD